ncbi:MAG: hypothetical protein IPL40_06425 [Proteobacteria bacterium]|nr:hypothetical protein [Pseudomonadota bacterium]
MPALLLALGACASLIACGRGRDELREDEAVKQVVEADRQLAQQEGALLSRRGSLQRSRTELRGQRAALQSRKLALDEADAPAKAALEQEESKLVALEAKLVAQELGLNHKLDALLQQKTGLAERLGKESFEARDLVFARREASLAQREREVGRREAEVGARERVLAEREQQLSARQSRGLIAGATRFVAEPAAAALKTGVTRREVEPIYQAARRTMEARGLLAVDLPPGADRLMTETRHAVARGDFSAARSAAEQLVVAVRGIAVDRAFVGAKMGRLSQAIRNRPPRGKGKARAEELFRQATTYYGDGQFAAANRQLNRIYALLR